MFVHYQCLSILKDPDSVASVKLKEKGLREILEPQLIVVQSYLFIGVFIFSCVQNMLRAVHQENLHTTDDCKIYLGRMFRVKFYECPEWYTDMEIANFILKKCILIHLDNNEDKFNMLVFMTQKLFVFAQDKCKLEGADAVMVQELLLGNFFYRYYYTLD